ncbi:MAG: insulinase family protein [Tannerellaceae bacterium]|nr:insulinase family protein [Tannerellaceae bacterium]
MRCSVALLALGLLTGCTGRGYRYEEVKGDPLKARIYTLGNGLKIYTTVNKETPRIQTYIAVRVGGKNDPAETTGLAHYFEHLMFKGTKQFGTQNYEQELPLLDAIEEGFEAYRQTTDPAERKAIYHTIDSLSFEASKISIPNEYDKLMSAIGADGTNAYTGFDMTVYTEDIPANQVENWARIQADRFENCVIRGFHTELETVYEEKNMSLTRDSRKVYEGMLSILFPDHPYGTQTVLGTQEHLKNPSIKNIKRYHDVWYVPNNMAICLSGDFDPDEAVALIDKYFGHLQPNPELPAPPAVNDTPPAGVQEKEVLGLEAENVTIGWRMPGANSRESDLLSLVSELMSNGQAGLMDVDLLQEQKTLSAYAANYAMADGSMFIAAGRPKAGQTLEQVRDLLLGEIAKLRNGDFDEGLLEAIVNNYKLYLMRQLEDNASRADMFVSSFINRTEWKDEVQAIDRLSKITKADITAFAAKYLGDNYAVIYKRQGQDPNEKKIDKPAITPIQTNRDTASAFLREMQAAAASVPPIEPVFPNFDKDITRLQATAANIPVLYRQNTTNKVFSLTFLFDMGSDHDKAIGTAFRYLDYLGTSSRSLKEINEAFYKLACHFDVSFDTDRTSVTLSGLAEKMPQALALLEELMADVRPDAEKYANLVDDVLKRRADAKLNQSANFSALLQYAIWGPKSPFTNILSADELRSMDPAEFTKRIQATNTFEHTILYYGPDKPKTLLSTLAQYHAVPQTLTPIPEVSSFRYEPTTVNRVLLAQYDAKQLYFAAVSNQGEAYNPAIQPTIELYNEYFSGSMNAIVFQEMREARGLAYSAQAFFLTPSRLKYPYIYRTFIATQNDKMADAITAFNTIINDMPESPAAFALARESLIARIRTERITKDDILRAYLRARDMGLDADRRKALYEAAQKLTLDDIVAFQHQWVQGRQYTYCLLGDAKDLDLAALASYGPLTVLTQEEIFGY